MTVTLLKAIKRRLLIVLLLLVATTGWAQQFVDGVRKGVIKVKFSPTVSASLNQIQVNARKNQVSTGIASFDEVAQTMSATNMYRLFPYNPKNENKLRKHGLHLWYVVELDEKSDPATAVNRFKKLKEVATAEVEREKTIAPFNVTRHETGTTPLTVLPFNDPMLKDQWHYENTGQSGHDGADINVFEAWTQTAGASDIVVSVHDQGVDVNHLDLRENIWTNGLELNGSPNVDDDGNGYIDDIHGYNFEKDRGAVDAQFHGTHVAGTVAAVSNNGIGVSGVAGGTGAGDGVKVMSLQILGGAPIELSYVYAADNGAVISQNSWGYTTPGYADQSVIDAIHYFIAEAGNYPGSPMRGGIVIFAAGNSNVDDEYYPAYSSETMAVAALGPEWKKASYSNFGTWIEIAAPGGDQVYGGKNGVLSTIPDNQYAFIQGTSMACPHVSGIAALALANRTRQLTNVELWNKLITGVVDVDQYNPDYQGKLGLGAIDAALAIKNDQGSAPVAIDNLAITGIAQEFATLKWSVTTDEDDGKPSTFTIYIHTQPITPNNLMAARKVTIKNISGVGEEVSFEVNELLGLTTYYFAVSANDRWGNTSSISNVVTGTTNQGPSISVDENSAQIELLVDAPLSTTATHEITIKNGASGVLRWDHFTRHVNNTASFNASDLRYPVAGSRTGSREPKIAKRGVHAPTEILRSNEPAAMAFQPIEKSLSTYPTNIVGETDTTLTNSAAGRFLVTEEDGFNLTHTMMYLHHEPTKGPVIVEVFQGASPTKENRILAQEFSAWADVEGWAYVQLNEQLYFPKGTTFWIVYHVPAGNIYPLGIGFESDPTASANCFMSFDMGNSWSPLEQLLDTKDFAWNMVASSVNHTLGTYLTLEPGSGDVAGESEIVTTLTANASTLVNGTYSANLILTSNDAQKQEFRIPVNVTVTGHKPDIKHIDIADFGSVFQGTSKTLALELDNQGYGNFSDITATINNPQFEIVDYAPWQIVAREKAVVQIRFSPSAIGNINGSLILSNGNQKYEIALFGVGAETSKIVVTPQQQVLSRLALGQEVKAKVTVQNAGAFPLKYFIPGFDDKGVSSEWPSTYHSYGYKFRSSYATETNPLTYGFQDISSTGVNVTEHFRQQNWYYEVDMGFDFPFYGEKMRKIYIAKLGFTTFDNTVQPINVPRLGDFYGPKGYISLLGTFLDYAGQGDIFYKLELNRLIIQYNNVSDGFNVGESITAQLVLYSNGDIRLLYDVMGLSETNQQYLSILVEDPDKEDGLAIHNYEKPIQLYNQLALGLDYPGPDIITAVENGSGILMPGASADVKLTMSTGTLTEGTFNRYVNIVSNDPAQPQSSPLVQLRITTGGAVDPVVSLDTINFGSVFQNAIASKGFTVRNNGTAAARINSMAFANNRFRLTGDRRVTIAPGTYQPYTVTMPTTALGVREDVLTIRYADGTSDVIVIKGNVIDAPAITVDLSLLEETLAYGETVRKPLNIQNPGKSDLEFVTIGKQWLSFAPTVSGSQTVFPDFTYAYEKHNDGTEYQWVDIRENGTQLPFAEDIFDKHDYWRNLELPFPIQFYDKSYSTLKIGENGVISFEEDPEIMFFTDKIPSPMEGAFIMPYWTFGGFDYFTYPKEEVGLFYKFYEDKIIITWSFLVNNFGGMGDPVSAQIFLYKNGTMKFQYRVEESGNDLTSHFSSVGVQRSSTDGVSISNHSTLVHGKGLAFVLVPAIKHIVPAKSSLAGEITIDAQNLYGGQYSEALKFQTNVPGKENLEKPVAVTVTGEASYAESPDVDFGEKMIEFQFGMPVVNLADIEIVNDGSAALTITDARMADGTKNLSMAVWTLVDGWFGPEWMWVDIAELFNPWNGAPPVLTLLPGDRLQAKAIFNPSVAGEYSDELILTSNIEEKRITLRGSAIEPPVIKVTTNSVDVVMNKPSETALRRIKFNNLNGKSDLNYNVSIDYGRKNESATEAVSSTASTASLKFSSENGEREGTIRTLATYNRTIRHSEKETAEGRVGLGSGMPFTVATRYTAGSDGFNLSHVETWFQTEDLTEGIVRVEIRAGGTTIANAVKLTTGTLAFTGSGNDLKGSWHQIKMDAPAAIYPNETFYVIINYPMGPEHVQGILKNEESVPGRYYYFDGDFWQDLQEVPSDGFDTMGLLMFAAEETASPSAWLSIGTELSGVLAAGDTSSVHINMFGDIAAQGDQIAKVVITSNDPVRPTMTVPVSLHLNKAPEFVNPPVAVHMFEKDTVSIDINVKDAEGHTITVKSEETYEGVSYMFDGNILSIKIIKDYGDAGNYVFRFIATDQYDAQEAISLSTEVQHKNRAPQFIGDETLTFYSAGNLEEYYIEDFYSDPDKDDFTFTLSSSDDKIVDVFSSNSQFLIRPISAGEAKLVFTVTDSFGASARDTIQVTVNNVLGIEETDGGLKVFPNPVLNTAQVVLGNEWKGDVTIAITDASGRNHIMQGAKVYAAGAILVDVSSLAKGFYILKVATAEKQHSVKLIKE